ncbi:hypothetical protein PHMEG_00015822 [Phytophthora megakarya]|uniref:Uncharacterized protein n=1 Tax=Phytophthora megakarya TaxID=4795 RepID=A0A225W0G7_9STRA|nr:hypothetical protein PHMEG_00015822 [Phytophthora megakarya]
MLQFKAPEKEDSLLDCSVSFTHGERTSCDATSSRSVAEHDKGKVLLDNGRSISRGGAKLIVEHNISTVLNADQSAVFYEYLPTKTINTTGERTVWVKCSENDKERTTVMLLADGHGKKYSPVILFKA